MAFLPRKDILKYIESPAPPASISSIRILRAERLTTRIRLLASILLIAPNEPPSPPLVYRISRVGRV
jgi:hypothetical protein